MCLLVGALNSWMSHPKSNINLLLKPQTMWLVTQIWKSKMHAFYHRRKWTVETDTYMGARLVQSEGRWGLVVTVRGRGLTVKQPQQPSPFGWSNQQQPGVFYQINVNFAPTACSCTWVLGILSWTIIFLHRSAPIEHSVALQINCLCQIVLMAKLRLP